MATTSLTDTLRETLAVFDRSTRGVPLTTNEVAERLDLGRRSTYSRLERLAECDLVETKKVGARGRVWWRPPDGAPASLAFDGAGEAEREQFQSLVRAVEEYAIFVLGPDGLVRTWNEGAVRIKGYEGKEVVGEHVSTFYTEADREAGVPEENLATASAEGVAEDDGWRVRADGSRFPAHVTITAIRDDEGDLQGYVKVTRDLTDRREHERELGRERGLLERVLETSQIGIGVFEAGGDALLVNERFAALLGTAGNDVEEYALGDTPALDAEGEEIPYPERPAAVVLSTGEPVADERIQVEGADGVTRWLSVNAAPLDTDADGVVVTMADVTQLEEQTRQLSRQRDEIGAELEQVFDRVDDAFWALDEEFRFTYINDRAADILEKSPGELVGRNVWEALPWLSDLRAKENFEEAMETGQTRYYEDYVEATGRWYDVRVYPSETGLSVYYRDITERKERERALAESERHNRALVENFPNGAVGLFDSDLRHIVVGGRLFDDLGLTPDELEGLTLGETMPPELVAQMEPHFHAVFDGESREFDVELGDSVRSFRTHPVRDDDGEIVAGLGVSQDVTDRRMRERELERYETIVETVDDGIYAVDADANFVLVNDAFCEMVGYDREEILGQPASTIHDDEVTPRAEQLAREVVAGDRDLATIDLDVYTKEGEAIPVESRLAPYPLGDDYGRCGVVRDMTERIERERELERYVGIVDAVGEPVYELDEQGRFSFVNDAMVERSGYEKSELLGAHVSIGMDEAAVERVEGHIADLLEDGGGRTTVEFDVTTKDGERIPAENRLFVRTDGDGGFVGSAGLLWDLTERKERERELSRFKRAVEASGHAIYMTDVDGTITFVNPAFEEVTGYPAEVAVGDTPRILQSGEHDDDYYRTLWETVHAGEVWEEEITDRRRTGELYYAEQTIAPVTDEKGEVDRFVAVQNDVTDRVERERELERQRERLTALNDLNGVVREITDAVIEQSTREEIERIVCERLAETESYSFAWIGDVDSHSGAVNLRAEAGVEGYLDDVTITVDPADPRSTGPTGRALIEREIQVAQDVQAETSHDPWRGAIDEYGFRSSAAIPIVHEGALFGALNVYADRPNAFTEDEQAVVGQLGEVVGHAIAAVERKRALMGDEIVEIDFQLKDVFGALDLPIEVDGTISLDRTVPLGDDSFLVYGTATGGAMDAVGAMVETPELPHWTSANVISRRKDSTRFELRLDRPPVISTVASHGGRVDEARIEDGDYYMRVHLAPSADVRHVVDAVERVYPAITMVSRQQVARGQPAGAVTGDPPLAELTDRQRAAVETAFYSGYFGWPRDSNGEDVAASLGIDPSTFHHHLRTAERKILGSVLGADAPA